MAWTTLVESGVNYTHTFTYAYQADESREVTSIEGIASNVSSGSVAAADSLVKFDGFGRRISMNYDVANGTTT